MLIVFSGLDGAGKSTQIEKLVSRLASNNKSCVTFWARGGYTPGFEFLKRFIRLFLGKKLPTSGLSSKRKEVLSRTWVAKLWLNLAIFDLIIFWGIWIRWKIFWGNLVICDRYLNDTNLDFNQNFQGVKFEKFLLWRVLLILCPKPDCSFVLWVPAKLALERNVKKNEPFPDTEETLIWRLSHYLGESLFLNKENSKLDCSFEADNIHQKIWNIISSNAKFKEMKIET